MKTKILFKDLQLNNAPFERLVFDSHNVSDKYVLLDDINEKRWKLKIKVFQALKITPIDCANLKFFIGGDFSNDCFDDKEGFPVPQFRKHIMEVQESEWINELKAKLNEVDLNADFMDNARHFLIPCYDNIIEIIGWDLELDEVID